MSIFSFLWSGVPTEYRRETYPQDAAVAKGQSSYQYAGKVTKIENIQNIKKIEIDNVVELITIPDEQRKNAQSKINQLFWKSILLTCGGIAGTGYTSYRIYNNDDSSQTANWLALVALAVSAIWTATKIFEASDEYHKWNDPTEQICAKRRNHSQNFNQLRNLKLRDVLYTPDETKDVFFRNLNLSIDEFESSKRSGSPEQMGLQIANLINNCPLTSSNVADTFNGNSIFNPNKPEFQWNTSDVRNLAKQWDDLTDEYLKLNADVSIRAGDIKDTEFAASSAIFGAGRVGNEVIRRNHDNQLKQARNQREREEINNQRVSNHQTAALTEILAQGGVSVYSNIKEAQLKRETNKKIVDHFNPKISSIFRDFQNLRKQENI